MSGDYGSMQARIADELYGRTDLTSQIKLAILSAINHYARERFWFNEGISTAVTTANMPNIDIPLGANENFIYEDTLKVTYANSTYPMRKTTWREMEALRISSTVTTSVPYWWAYYEDNFWFYPTPNAAYTLTCSFVEKLDELVDDTDTNAWMTEGEEMIRHRAKADVRLNILREPAALADLAAMMAAGEPYYSYPERIAHKSLAGLAVMKMTTGRTVPTQF